MAQLSSTVASHPGGSCFSKTPLSIWSALFLRPPSSVLLSLHLPLLLFSHCHKPLTLSASRPLLLFLSLPGPSPTPRPALRLPVFPSCCSLFFIIPGSLCGLGWGLRLRPSLYANSECPCARKRKLLSHSHQASTNARMHKQTCPASHSASLPPHPARSLNLLNWTIFFLTIIKRNHNIRFFGGTILCWYCPLSLHS